MAEQSWVVGCLGIFLIIILNNKKTLQKGRLLFLIYFKQQKREGKELKLDIPFTPLSYPLITPY